MQGFDDVGPQTRAVRDVDLEFFFLFLLVFVQQAFVGGETGFGFRLTAFGVLPYPVQFALEGLGALGSLFFFLGQALGLLLQPRGVVALPGNALAPVQFQDPSGYVVQEVAVVGNGDDRALVLPQVFLEPEDALGIQMVGRLVQQQHVRLLKQQAAQGDAAAFTARKGRYGCVAGRSAQGVHRDVEPGIEFPGVLGIDLVLEFPLAAHQGVHLVGVGVHFLQAELLVDPVVFVQNGHGVGHAFLDNVEHRLVRVELRVLRQVAYGVARSEDHFALVFLFDAGDDAQQGGLSGAVESQDADLGTVEKAEVYVFQDGFACAGVGLGHSRHGKNDFVVVCHGQ